MAQFTSKYSGEITKDDVFAYVYAVLHDPVYRETYALNLRREFPRIPFYSNFRRWRDWGEALLDLHIGYEMVDPWPLEQVDIPDPRAASSGVAPAVLLRSEPDRGAIVLDAVTQLVGVPPEAWSYRLGNRSAIDWVLDQHKEKRPRDATIREQFEPYRFIDRKRDVIELLKRVTTVSVKTQEIVEAMRGAPR